MIKRFAGLFPLSRDVPLGCDAERRIKLPIRTTHLQADYAKEPIFFRIVSQFLAQLLVRGLRSRVWVKLLQLSVIRGGAKVFRAIRLFPWRRVFRLFPWERQSINTRRRLEYKTCSTQLCQILWRNSRKRGLSLSKTYGNKTGMRPVKFQVNPILSFIFVRAWFFPCFSHYFD